MNKILKNKKDKFIPNTLIGEGILLETGILSGTESVRIDGILKGNIDLENSFCIGEKGIVHGNIKAQHMIIAGKVIGNISSNYTIYLTSTANINGTIKSNNIIVEAGAIVNGNLSIGN